MQFSPAPVRRPPDWTANRPLRIGMLAGSLSNSGGGVTECVRAVSAALHQGTDCNVELFTVQGPDEPAVDTIPDGVSAYVAPASGPPAFGYSPHLVDALVDADLDVLHVHGLWMYMSVAALRWSRRTGRRYLVSPHGMLDPWAVGNSRLKKVVAATLYENRHLRGAACLHALCEAERQAIRAYGLDGPVCVVPNGVALPPQASGDTASRGPQTDGTAHVLLYLGRLHPKKGVHDLIEAWGDAAVDAAAPLGAWRLDIAGSGAEDYVRDLQARIEARALTDRVRLVGPKYGPEKEAAFAAASAFILPSLSEGQPVAVLEAWAHGLPALVTEACNLPEGFAASAAMRIETGRHGIADGLKRFTAMDGAELAAMAHAARTLIERQFTWPRSAAQLDLVYRWMLGKEPRPDCMADDAERRRTAAP